MLARLSRLLLLVSLVVSSAQALIVGRGIADITGLASEGALYGYAQPSQTAQGIHLRQYSRAFVFDDGNKMAAFVVAEVTMISEAVHTQVMESLAEQFGGLFTEENVMLSSTHTHAAPGGYHTYWMYQSATGGFINETFEILVNGIVLSIARAHSDLRPADVTVNSADLEGANINRSPYAYSNNPPDELIQYEHDVTKLMTLLKITDTATSQGLGAISFFGIHPTSMKNYNHLVSTDNKGYAAQMMERYLNPGALPGQGSVLGAFAQTTEADSSPNTDGSRCDVTNDYCSDVTSTCPEWPKDPRKCTGRGPVGEQFADTAYIGDKQFQLAKTLYETAVESVGSAVDYRFQWVNMSDVTVLDEQNNPIKTCRPSMGYSFAAGATDGPGIPPFTQCMLEPIDNITDIMGRIYNMSQQLIDCHAPKPILLPTGELVNPWPWQPEIIPIQLLRIGSVFLAGLPAEVATMAGRRLENAIKQSLTEHGVTGNIRVIILAVTNAYSSYVVTYEEYQVQRYEGASTIFGPHTLQAYTIKFQELAVAMATGAAVSRGPTPPDLRGVPDDALGIIRRDDTPDGLTYGDVLEDVTSQVMQGDTVRATFVAGNPRNNPTIATFLEVQRKVDVDQWVVEATDANWETKFVYSATCDGGRNASDCSIIHQLSNATVEWTVPVDQPVATYRLVHYGSARQSAQQVVDYTGVSSEFTVVTGNSRNNSRYNYNYNY